MNFGLGALLGFDDDQQNDEEVAEEQEQEEDEAPAFVMETYPTADKVPYAEFLGKSIEILLGRDTGDDNMTEWDLLSDEDGVETWSGVVTGTSWNAFKIKQDIYASKEEVEKALMSVDTLLSLDDMTTTIEILHHAGDDGEITLRHCLSQGVFPFATREFLVVTGATEMLDGRIVIATRSVEVEDVPLFAEGNVRAIDIINGIIIEEKKDEEGNTCSMVTLIGQADLGGYVPATIINMLGTSATAKVLVKLEEYFEKKDTEKEAEPASS